MKTNILLPKKIKVGFQKREDCFTKSLAYVIYYDEKGKLRKETSWDNWRDQKIDSQEFDNEPTSGFVLNKKVGGYKSDWNFRQAYCRIYDPRGFEFEITVPNLLYILENTSSIRGKGLEGEFVYCWDKADLVLLPTSAPEYEKIKSFTEMVTDKEKITKKDVVLGGTYKTNKDEDLIYLGYFDKYERDYYQPDGRAYSKTTYKSIGKRHFFKSAKLEKDDRGFKYLSGLSKLVKTVSATAHPDYAKIMSQLERSDSYSPINPDKDEFLDVSNDKLQKIVKEYYYSSADLYCTIDGVFLKVKLQKANNNYCFYQIERAVRLESLAEKHSYGSYWSWREDTEVKKIEEKLRRENYFSSWDYRTNKNAKEWTLEELNDQFKFKIRQRYLMNGKKYQERY